MEEKMEILSVEQVAELLQLKPTTIRKMLQRGKLPGKKFGRSWRVLRSDIMDYMRGDKQ